MNKWLVIIAFLCLHAHYSSAQSQADSAFYGTKQSRWLSGKAGLWNVTMTMRPAPEAAPMVISQIEAERMMVGAFCLHEVMRPAKGAAMPQFQRLSDLDYNYNDARWDYMSIDTRITAGIMNFTNALNEGDSIVSYMLNTPHPGFGPKQTNRGKNLRVKNVITAIDKDHETVRQYWKLTDGEEWLAVQYDYIRKR